MSNKIKNIENKGWEEMSTLLDRHLPQEKKSKRVIPFWSVSAAASLIVVSGFFLLNKELKEKSELETEKNNAVMVDNAREKISKTAIEKVQDQSEIKSAVISEALNNPIVSNLSMPTLHKYKTNNDKLPTSEIKELETTVANLSSLDIKNGDHTQNANLVVVEKVDNTSYVGENSIVDSKNSSTSENVDLDIISVTEENQIVSSSENNVQSVTNITEEKEIENNHVKLSELAANKEGLTLVQQDIPSRDLYIRPGLGTIFNVDDKTKSGSISLDLGYKINKTSFELGGEYIRHNAVNLTSSEVKEFVSNRTLGTPSSIVPIQNLNQLKSSSSYTFNNGSLIALNAKIHYDISKKLGIYAGAQLSQSSSFEQIRISDNSSTDATSFAVSQDKAAELNILNDYLYSTGSGNVILGKETTGFSYLLGLSYRVLKKFHINIGFKSNYRPKDSINEYAVAHNLPLFTVGGTYKMF